jgi:hypothetical protein
MKFAPVQKKIGMYRFVIKEDITFPNTLIKEPFEDPDKKWIVINENGDIKITASNPDANGYAWDGCTPKIDILNLFSVGVPDGRVNVETGKPITYYASLVHDVLCQFRGKTWKHRKENDLVFLNYLGDFKLRYVYYYAVRAYSTISIIMEIIKNKVKSKFNNLRTDQNN